MAQNKIEGEYKSFINKAYIKPIAKSFINFEKCHAEFKSMMNISPEVHQKIFKALSYYLK